MRGVGMITVVSAALFLTGCQVPRDPEGTLERAAGGTIRAGVVHHPPWTETGGGGRLAGVEVELLRRFVAELDAEIEWVEGSQAELIPALEHGTLDLVVGGLTAKTPGLEKVGVTRSYLETTLVVGFPSGRTVPDDLEGIRVSVERGTEAEALVEDASAIPVAVETIERSARPAAVEAWELDGLGLVDHGFHLATHEHVFATRPGENAWLVRLERFLQTQAETTRRLLDRAA